MLIIFLCARVNVGRAYPHERYGLELDKESDVTEKVLREGCFGGRGWWEGG